VSRETTLSIAVGDGAVTAIASEPETAGRATFLYTPGAGSNVHDPFGKQLCRALAPLGVRAIRFQFLYQEAGRRSPDRPAILEQTWRAAIDQLAGEVTVVGGRSMGGRIASQVVADGAAVAGLALFAYPLHAPGKPERRRDEHLTAITVPTLLCSGTRDAFASPEELTEAAALIADSTVHHLESADHGFSAPKSSGRKREEVYAEATTTFVEWLEAEGLL
jgi:predicted alpha/beta-hydrolase family hydrolase